MAIDTSVEQQASLIYEREVQAYLSQNLSMLGDARLKLIQTEYPIKFGKDFGRIDILASDHNQDLVVIEVKRGVAGRGAVGQVQSYMGSVMTEFPGKKVSGVLVAMGLDEAARAALMVTFDIRYFEFRTRFDFFHREIIKPEVRQSQAASKAEVRQNYWEQLGGRVTNETVNCRDCEKLVRVVLVGSSRLCGVCGKSVT